MSDEINWNDALKNNPSEAMSLSDVETDTVHEVTFLSVRQTTDLNIVASVDSETLQGDTLWLRGKFGPQNGLLSLIRAVNGPENIQGSTVKFSKIASEKSPAGYAFRWFLEA